MRTALLVLLVCPLVVLALSVAVDPFDEFVLRFGKRYASPAHRQHAKQAFAENVARIPQLRAQGGGAEFGVTKFADLTASVRLCAALERCDASIFHFRHLNEALSYVTRIRDQKPAVWILLLHAHSYAGVCRADSDVGRQPTSLPSPRVGGGARDTLARLLAACILGLA